jgi:hypothetical protein
LGDAGPVAPAFASAVDVPGAGVLCALPALVLNGLLHDEQKQTERRLVQPDGYYPLSALLLLFSFLALARVRSLERVRYLPAGEWGRIVGLDRIPEVKTLREKLEAICQPASVNAWAHDMSVFWMRLDEELAGILYIDGHVRTYTGSQTVMPRRHSSRERLCVRSVMDYWVNDTHGTPFFVVTAMGNEGMLHYLRTNIIQRLLKDVPGQPSDSELAANPDLHRFILIFDREGWSPLFFAELWRDHRIAVQTYQRGNYAAWPIAEFTEHVVPVAYSNTAAMRLAERPYTHKKCVSRADGTDGTDRADRADRADSTESAVRFREIRRLCDDNDHQASIITTVVSGKTAAIAGHMFARWTQENFFKYAAREFAIDHLAGHAPVEAPGCETIKNPAYVKLDAQRRKALADIAKIDAKLARLTLTSNEPKVVAEHLDRKNTLTEQRGKLTAARKNDLDARKKIPKRLSLASLPEAQRPAFIAPHRATFLNTIRIIAYRAETAMAIQLRNHISRSNDARALLQDLFKHDADLIVDHHTNTLTVRLHHFTNPQASRSIADLLTTLTHTETIYPGTNLVLKYDMVSDPNPAGQDV